MNNVTQKAFHEKPRQVKILEEYTFSPFDGAQHDGIIFVLFKLPTVKLGDNLHGNVRPPARLCLSVQALL